MVPSPSSTPASGLLRATVFAATLLLPASSARSTEVRVDGLLHGRASGVASQAPWIEAAFGKLTDGSGSPDDFDERYQAEAQLGLDLRAGEALLVHVHGLARTQRDAARGSQLGLVEAFVQSRPELSPSTRLRATAGLMFPPTSRENVDPLWSSPYTLTLSALNTWVAEELRLAGAELGVTHKTARDDDLLAAVTVFGANDSAGSLLAWRGWTLGDRLSSLGEELPLPPLPSLEPGGAFGLQRADGTRPIDELDGRPGFQARARWSRPPPPQVDQARGRPPDAAVRKRHEPVHGPRLARGPHLEPDIHGTLRSGQRRPAVTHGPKGVGPLGKPGRVRNVGEGRVERRPDLHRLHVEVSHPVLPGRSIPPPSNRLDLIGRGL
jgi:hypothetical protein